jgi:hypothetical protein
MNKSELRQHWGDKLFLYSKQSEHEHFADRKNRLFMFKTNHSLQLNRAGYSLLLRSKIPVIKTNVTWSGSVHDLLLLANVSDVPYYLMHENYGREVSLQTIESDRIHALLLLEGDIKAWANMYDPF